MERQVSCSASWLSRHLATPGRRDGECREDAAIVVDCRPTEAYRAAHVRGAVSLSMPTLMMRRLARRQLAATTVIGVIHQRTVSWRYIIDLY